MSLISPAIKVIRVSLANQNGRAAFGLLFTVKCTPRLLEVDCAAGKIAAADASHTAIIKCAAETRISHGSHCLDHLRIFAQKQICVPQVNGQAGFDPRPR
jgi:hypothetical protein